MWNNDADSDMDAGADADNADPDADADGPQATLSSQCLKGEEPLSIYFLVTQPHPLLYYLTFGCFLEQMEICGKVSFKGRVPLPHTCLRKSPVLPRLVSDLLSSRGWP